VIAITLITILFFLGSIYFCVHLFTKEESTIHRVGSEAGRIDDELISIDYLSGNHKYSMNAIIFRYIHYLHYIQQCFTLSFRRHR
jgi:hypothetical protein